MDARCRYCLILIVLFTALTGYGQNLRVTSLTVGAGGVSNAAMHNSISWPNTGLTNYFYWLEGGGRPALIAGYPGSPGGINAPKIFEVRRTGHPDNGLYIGSPGSGSMDGWDFINLRMQGSTDGNPDPRAVIAWSAAGDEEFGYRFREKSAEIIGGIGGHLWDMSDGVNLRVGTNTIPLRFGGSSVGVETNLLFKELAANETPPSGFGSFYFKSDSKPYAKSDGATEYDLSAVGGGSTLLDPIVVTNLTAVSNITIQLKGDAPTDSSSRWPLLIYSWTNHDNKVHSPFGIAVAQFATSSTHSNTAWSLGDDPNRFDGLATAQLTFENAWNANGQQKEVYWNFHKTGGSTDYRPQFMEVITNGEPTLLSLSGPWFFRNNNTKGAQTNYLEVGTDGANAGNHSIKGTVAVKGGAPYNSGFAAIDIQDRGFLAWRSTDEARGYYIRVDTDETTLALFNDGAGHTGIKITGGVANLPTSVSLTADNQSVNCSNRTYIKLSSDNGTAGNRTFVLTGTVAAMSGQLITLEWTGTNAGELADDGSLTGGGNVRLSAVWTPTQYDTLTLRFNGTDLVEMNRSTN